MIRTVFHWRALLVYLAVVLLLGVVVAIVVDWASWTWQTAGVVACLFGIVSGGFMTVLWPVELWHYEEIP